MFELIQKDTYSCMIHMLLMNINLQVFYQELSFIHVLMLNVTLLCLTWIGQFYEHSCMHLDGQLSPSCQPKNSNKQKLVSNTFNQNYSSESTISTYWLYAIPSMFIMIFVLSIPLNENAYVVDCYGKSWLYSYHELDAQFIFIA